MLASYYRSRIQVTARQPRRALITLYISFNQRRRLAKEGLVGLNLKEDRPILHQATDVIHNSTPQRCAWSRNLDANFKCLREEYRGQCERTNKRTNEQINT